MPAFPSLGKPAFVPLNRTPLSQRLGPGTTITSLQTQKGKIVVNAITSANLLWSLARDNALTNCGRDFGFSFASCSSPRFICGLPTAWGIGDQPEAWGRGDLPEAYLLHRARETCLRPTCCTGHGRPTCCSAASFLKEGSRRQSCGICENKGRDRQKGRDECRTCANNHSPSFRKEAAEQQVGLLWPTQQVGLELVSYRSLINLRMLSCRSQEAFLSISGSSPVPYPAGQSLSS